MEKITITPLQPYTQDLSLDMRAAGRVVKEGFGGRSLDECIRDAQDHLSDAKLLHAAYNDNELVGFAMYETFDDRTLYLNGIVIKREYQAQKIGQRMLVRAISLTEADYLCAVTRNPSILRLMQVVCDFVEPSPDSQRLSKEQIGTLAQRIGIPEATIPYHRDRYPEDLYDVQPKHKNSDLQRCFDEFYDLGNQRDAVMLVGGCRHVE